MDTLFGKIKSLNGNILSQIYTHKCGFKKLYHIKKADGPNIGQTLVDFIHEVGAPDHLTFDGAQVQKGQNTLFFNTLKKNTIGWHISAPRRPDENPAEQAILQLKMQWYAMKQQHNVPDRLWDFKQARG